MAENKTTDTMGKHKSLNTTSSGNMGKVSDIRVPKDYIVRQLRKQYQTKVSYNINEIENYIKSEIHVQYVCVDFLTATWISPSDLKKKKCFIVD